MKEVIKSRQLPFKPTQFQQDYLANCFGARRFVYNNFIWLNKQLIKDGKKSLTYGEASKRLSEMRNATDSEYPWLTTTPRDIQENALRDLYQAYKMHFKRPDHFEMPRFAKKTYSGSCRFAIEPKCKKFELGVYCKPNKVIGELDVNWRAATDFSDKKPKALTIRKRPDGKYFISVAVEQPIVQHVPTGKQVGIDVNETQLIVASDGTKIEFTKKYLRLERRLKKEQAVLSRKKDKTSNRYKKQRLLVAKLHQQKTNAMEDIYQQVSSKLVRENDVLCIETLNIVGMKKNKRRAGGIHRAAWGRFFTMLEYKCKWHDKRLVKIDRWFASSQICSECGAKNKNLKDYHTYVCKSCGYSDDRDLNASYNILAEGIGQAPSAGAGSLMQEQDEKLKSSSVTSVTDRGNHEVRPSQNPTIQTIHSCHEAGAEMS